MSKDWTTILSEPPHFQDLGTSSIAYRRVGAGEPLVFITGWPFNQTTYYNLIPHLARLAYEDEAEFRGATGALSMSDDGRITRKLPWGKIVNGKPELLGGT